MHQSEMLFDILVFLSAAVVVVTAFHRLKTSPILGYLVAGTLIGPFGLALIRESESARSLAEFGVVFLLFTIGLELSVKRLRSMAHLVFGLGGLQVLVTATIITAAAITIGVSREVAIVIGGGLALSSTAFVMQLLSERGERSTPYGQTSLSILLFQDLAIVPLLMLVTLLAAKHDAFWGAMGLAVVEAVAALIGMLIVGRLVLRPLFHMIAKTGSGELFIATTLFVILGTGWVLSQFEVSMVLGAFLAGVLLSETEYRHQIESDIRPFKGILLGLFFMTVGMSIDLSLVGRRLPEISLAVISVISLKSLVIAGLTLTFKQPATSALRTGLILSQGGEFGFVLFLSAGSLGLIPNSTVQFLLTVVALSMVTTPVMAIAGEKLAALLEQRGSQHLAPAGHEDIDLSDHVIIAGFGRVGQVAALLLGAAGFRCIALDLDATRIKSCRTMGYDVHFGDASLTAILRSVGVERAQGLIVTIDQHTVVDHIISAAQEVAPDIKIFARARDLGHVKKLEALGATEAVPESLEASLQLGSIAMTSLGVNPGDALAIVQDIRDDNYASVRREIE